MLAAQRTPCLSGRQPSLFITKCKSKKTYRNIALSVAFLCLLKQNMRKCIIFTRIFCPFATNVVPRTPDAKAAPRDVLSAGSAAETHYILGPGVGRFAFLSRKSKNIFISAEFSARQILLIDSRTNQKSSLL